MTLADWAKKITWLIFLNWVVPIFRDALLFLGIIKHSGRQPFLIGNLAGNYSFEELKKRLQAKGFHNGFVAWVDDDEFFSLRVLDGFHFQYHLRVFKDRELRGHYEHTPESHPFLHLKGSFLEPRTEWFKEMLGEMLAKD